MNHITKLPKFATHYKVKATEEIGEWVSATDPLGTFELRMSNGSVKALQHDEIEISTPEQYIDALRKKPN